MQDFHNEADTRAKLIDPTLHQRGWSEDKIKREETPGAVDVVDGKPRKRSQGRKDAVTGQPLSRDELPESFSKTEYEYRILLPDRVREMTRDLFNHLVATGGPEQKTIIFCVRDTHADEVANAMNNLYARWCADNNRDRVDPYAFKCTAASGGSDYVADLRGASRHHFIATTVDLLSTGVDVPSVKNIVFFKYVRSPIAFYILAELGYGLAPKTRITRADAFFYKHDQWLNTLPDLTADTLKALTMQFARTGTDGLENPRVFTTPEVTQAGGINALAQIGQPADLLIKIKERIFAL